MKGSPKAALRRGVMALTLGALSIPAIALAQEITPGVYACEGAAQAGPCGPSSGNSASPASSVIGYEYEPVSRTRFQRIVAVVGDKQYDGKPVSIFRAAGDPDDDFESLERTAIDECQRSGATNCRSLIRSDGQCIAANLSSDGSLVSTLGSVRVAYADNGWQEFYYRDMKKLRRAATKACEAQHGKNRCSAIPLYDNSYMTEICPSLVLYRD